MELQTLKVSTRRSGGKQGARHVRVSGSLPCVLYGGEGGPVSLMVDGKRFETLIHRSRSGEHAILQLEVDDNSALSTPALLKEVQRHPIRGHILHADFFRIRLDAKITTRVPIKIVGQAPGILEGGVLDHQVRELEVECMALDVPEAIVCDVSGLNMGDSLHVRDLAAPDRVTILTDADRGVVAVLAPRAVKEAEVETVEAEAVQPEVITEKKPKEEEKEQKDQKDQKKK